MNPMKQSFIQPDSQSARREPLAFLDPILYNMYIMKIYTTTQARSSIKKLIDRTKYHGEVFGIGRRQSIDALVIPFPEHYNADADDITNVNAYSRSFDFLKEEPAIYKLSDVKKRYA